MTYIRVTKDEYQIRQNCGYGFEEVCSEDNYKEAKQRLKEYRENQPEYVVKIVKVRVSLNDVKS